MYVFHFYYFIDLNNKIRYLLFYTSYLTVLTKITNSQKCQKFCNNRIIKKQFINNNFCVYRNVFILFFIKCIVCCKFFIKVKNRVSFRDIRKYPQPFFLE